jgi:hydroxymethylpyrimidine pyrophosphatase-like HAD family hydrolase
VGNDENDKSMIKAAGLGVAVSNARQILKESADYITENDNNHGAIGEIIKKFILS